MGDHLLGFAHMKSYFAEYGRREPSGQRHTMMAYTMGDPSLTVWEHMNRDPARMKDFMSAMSAVATPMGGLEAYDFSWVVDAGEREPDRTLVVDVGGGRGHSLEAILKATPGLDMSRCVVQDLPLVIDEARELVIGERTKARFVGMDFHAEKPVEGAFVYLIRRCLHDYGDDDCVNILRYIRHAMGRDSRLLIAEQVMENPPKAIDAAFDLYMSVIGGKERMRGDFEEISRRAGLQVKEVYRCQPDIAVVECVPV